MTLAIGQTLDDRYLIEAQIGSGGMARVFRASNQRTGKPVAVKEIYVPQNETADTIRGWLKREIKALMVLDHPGVVRLIDHGEAPDGTPFVVTELLEGSDLEKRGRLSTDEVIDVAIQALGALQAAHALSIVHRDLKPGNLFMCNDGRVVILDFGLARAVSTQVSSTLAEGFGTKIMGTPQFWSPEQIKGVTLDPKSDVYSMGGALCYLITGHPPYSGSTPFEIAAQIMQKKREVLARSPLNDLVESMLHEDSAARPSVTDLLPRFEALRRSESTQVVSNTAIVSATRVVTMSVPRRRRLPAGMWALAATLLLLPAIYVVFSTRSVATGERTPESSAPAALPLPPPHEEPPPLAVTEPPAPLPASETPRPAAKVVSTGTLVVSLKQWAELVVDGVSIGKKEVGAKVPLTAGKHDVIFKNAKFGEQRHTVTIKPNKETALKVDFLGP